MIKTMSANDPSDRVKINLLPEMIYRAKLSDIPIINLEIFDGIENLINEDMMQLNSSEQWETYLEKLNHLT